MLSKTLSETTSPTGCGASHGPKIATSNQTTHIAAPIRPSHAGPWDTLPADRSGVLGFVIHMAGVPQAIGNRRGRAFRGLSHHRCRCFTDAGGQLVDHAVLDAQH